LPIDRQQVRSMDPWASGDLALTYQCLVSELFGNSVNVLKATKSNRARLRAQRYYQSSCQTSRGPGYHSSYRIYNVLYQKVDSFSCQEPVYALIFQKSVSQFKGKTIGKALELISTEVTDSKAVENHQGCSNRMKQAFMEI